MNKGEASKTKINKRKKNYYYHPAKKGKFIETGLKGFLCSCNFKENECIRESYNILNEYADEFYGYEKVNVNCDDEDAETKEIEKELASEVMKLKDKNKYCNRFQLVDSGAKNLIFIKTTLEKPVDFVGKIVKDINDKKQQKTRYLIRLVPVEVISKAYVDDIVRALTPLIELHFKDSKKLYSISFNHRNNNSLPRDILIKEIVKVIQSVGPESKVELKEPEISVLVEVIKGFAFLAVIPEFFKYKKFNLITIAQENPKNCANDENKLEEEIKPFE